VFSEDSLVLIADDMQTIRKLVTKALRDLGYKNIIEASDGAEAWDLLISKSDPAVQLVISDVNMPNASGLDFLKKARSDQRYQKLPFILLTTESEFKTVSDALASGASGYILKPFTLTALRGQIEKAVAKLGE
jgi:two-component system, chemotaxis family, chemotaxis protein CheY